MICDEEAETLLSRHPNAFLLLAQIAMRAKWKDCPITNLKKGEAWIGDYKAAGLRTPKAYRYAQKVLEKCGIAAFRGASKGTVATLTNSEVFSISPPSRGEQTDNQGASKGQTEGEQGATNKTDRQIHGPNGTDDLFPQTATQPAKIQKPAQDELAEAIWKTAPIESRRRSSRKELKAELKKIPVSELPAANDLIAALEEWKGCRDWTKQDGEYIPGIHRWVSGRKWETPPNIIPEKIIPNTPEMLAVGSLFGRKPDEPWTREEVELFTRAAPRSAEISLLGQFYEVPPDKLPKRDFSKRSNLVALLREWRPAVEDAKTFLADHPEFHNPAAHYSAA